MSSADAFDGPGDLLRAYGQRLKKRFGQHFLTDPDVLGRICDAGEVEESTAVLEIGPGCGTLTWTLLQRGARVTAVELDRDAAAFLEEAFGDESRFELIEADALDLDFAAMLGGGGPWSVVANLPYNVATEILFRLFEARSHVDRMALMFQREVAERICADPGSKAYGGLTLMSRLHADAEIVFSLRPGAFTPPPRVDSSVVAFEPIDATRIDDDELRGRFAQLVDAAFKARRKTLPNALRIGGFDKDEVVEALGEMGVNPAIRPEKVSFQQFCEIARRVSPPSD